jgi:hypothetical protein
VAGNDCRFRLRVPAVSRSALSHNHFRLINSERLALATNGIRTNLVLSDLMAAGWFLIMDAIAAAYYAAAALAPACEPKCGY